MRRLAPLCALLVVAATACRRHDAPAGATSATAPASAPPAEPSAPTPTESASASASAVPAASAAPTGDAAFAGVSHQDHVRRSLYLWVTAEQATLLRRDRSLIEVLRRSRTRPLDASLAARRDPTTLQLLQALKKDDRKPTAQAWSTPWGAAPASTEGRWSIVRVELRPEATVGRYDDRQPKPWSFVDGKGNELAPGKVMAHPERLGAVYYVLGGEPSRRGYALVSEEALASWSLETPALDAELAAAVTRLRALPAAAPDEGWSQRVAAEVWPTQTEGFDATLALADPAHQAASAPALAAQIERARATAHPLVVKPSPAAKPFSDLLEKGVQRQVCTEHGDKTRCNPLPPSSRRAYNGRFCADEAGHMIDCAKSR